MFEIKKILKISAVYICVLLGCIATYVFWAHGKIVVEQVFFLDETVLQMSWVKKIALIIILISLALSFAIFLLKSPKIKFMISVLAILLFVYVFSVFDYIRYNISFSDFYEKEYKPFVLEGGSFPKDKRNLIMVYLESMEQDYAGKDVKPYLDELQKDNTGLFGFKQLKTTNMTIGSQFAGLCGLPLKKIRLNTDFYNFKPNIVCVPDILKKAGYNLSYLKAAKISFSGAEMFAKQHSFDNVKGYEELAPTLRKSFSDVEGNNFGGLKDRMLFEAAKSELKNLKQPFMLVLTTLDMHSSPNYFLDEGCETKFGDIRDAVGCVERNVKDFVEWLKKQEFYENTTIILSGDHIGNFESMLPSSSASTYNTIINSASKNLLKKHLWTTYDLAPTILNSLGFDVAHLGLGRSLYRDENTLFEKYGNVFEFKAMSKNKLYDKLSKNNKKKYSYKNYALGKVLTNKQIGKYIDMGNNKFCNSASIMSLDIGNDFPENMTLKADIKAFVFEFDILLNGNIIFSHNDKKSKATKINVPIKKEWLGNDGKIIIETSFMQNINSYNPGGICFDNFVLQ